MKKSGFSIIFAKNSAASVNYIVASTAKQKINGSHEYVYRKLAWTLRNAVGIGECQICFEDIQKLPFFSRKLAEIFRLKLLQHAAQLNGDPSFTTETLPFPSFLYRQDSKIYHLPSKNPKIEIFVANKSPKSFDDRGFEYDKSRNRRSAYTKIG